MNEYEVRVKVTAIARVLASDEDEADDLVYNLAEDGDLTAYEVVDVDISDIEQVEARPSSAP